MKYIERFDQIDKTSTHDQCITYSHIPDLWKWHCHCDWESLGNSRIQKQQFVSRHHWCIASYNSHQSGIVCQEFFMSMESLLDCLLATDMHSLANKNYW